jgi:monovalent cation:H+ antiporter-2, CPA2 family
MHHDIPLISLMAVGLAFAFFGGLLAVRLNLPPLVGYLVAGIAIGPFTPGFVGDAHLAQQLAEIGVMLLMFGVGMHFSIKDLMAVRNVAVPGAVGQIVVATAMGTALAWFWGWSLGGGILFGLALSVASTVVLLRALESRDLLHTPDGQLAVGWLIVEDLVIVLVLVLLPALAGAPPAHVEAGAEAAGPVSEPTALWVTVALTLAKVAAFIALMLVVGTRLFPRLLGFVQRIGSRELFTLAVIALSLGIAYGSSKLFGVSLALGAFFAGMVIHGSDLSHRAEKELQPLQNVFAALFFVSVGMLFDYRVLVSQPLQVLAVVAIIVVGKSIAAMLIVLALRRPMQTAAVVATALAQIGEFSFILILMGIEFGLVPRTSQSLIVAGALISITLNPLIFHLVSRRFDLRPADQASDATSDPKTA